MEAPPLERKLVAILAADVEGYSRLMHEDEEATLATLSADRVIVDEIVASARGEISGSAGDGFLAEFGSVTDAFRAALAIQQALHRANTDRPADRRMMLRVGLNVGDVMVKDGDIFGDGVNIAARVESLAEPGGICVTRGVRDHLRDRVDQGFEDLGEHAVKNIARPVRVFRVVFDPAGDAELVPDGESRPSPALPSSAAAEGIELAFWQSVQASGDPAEYDAYLEQYPDGAFAALARARRFSQATPTAATAEANELELAFWDTVKDSDNPAMFEAYLAKFPDGEFKPLAEIRLTELASG